MAKTKTNSTRDMAVQSIIQPKLYESPNVLAGKNLETEEYSTFFYTPHTIAALLGIIGLVNFMIYFGDGLTTIPLKTFGIGSAVFLFLTFAGLYMPDTIVTRPHPFIWRFMLGANALYAMFMTYLALLPLDEARQMMAVFDENLGRPLPEKSYADDCRLFTPDNPESMIANLKDAMDVHVFAHFAGWIVKVLIMRDIKLCWICSVLFEIMELTFRHWLPNFYECWWDHLLLDVFGCNMIGIIIGAFIVRKFYVKKLNWIYEKKKEDDQYLYSKCTTVGRAFVKLKPSFLMRHDWQIFKSYTRFFGVLFFCFCINLVDLCNFFLKTILWVPANHSLLKYRLAILCPLGIAGTGEYFEYLTNKYATRVRPHMWILLYQVAIELTIVFKHYRVYVTDPFPKFVVIMWSTIIVAIFLILRFAVKKKQTLF